MRPVVYNHRINRTPATPESRLPVSFGFSKLDSGCSQGYT